MRELSINELDQARRTLCAGRHWTAPSTEIQVRPLAGRSVAIYPRLPTAETCLQIEHWIIQINGQTWACHIWEDHNSHKPMEEEEEGYW